MLFAPPHARFIHRDLDQPGAEARLTAKLPQVRKGFQDGFLGYVLCFGFVAEQGQRGHINPAFVGLDQFGKEGGLSV